MSQTTLPRSSMFQRKSITALLDGRTGGHELKRCLSARSLVALGIGGIIGAGLFSLTGIAAADNAGPAVVLSFIVAAIGCAFAGLCYSELASMIPLSGSAYTYAYATLGELVAWIIGWDLVLEYAVGAATVSVSWSSYVLNLLHGFGVDIPPRLAACPFTTVTMPDGSHVAGLINLPAILIIVCVSLLLVRGISESAGVNMALTVVKVAIVLAVIGFCAGHVNTANYHPFIPPNTGSYGAFGISGIMRGAGVIFFAYIGFDAVSTCAAEAHRPERDIPIGILGSLGICTILYIGFALVLTGVVNYHAMHGDAKPVMTAIDVTRFAWLKIAVNVGVICGYSSVLLVNLLGQSRVFYAMAQDGLLPGIFSALHRRFDTPWLSNLVFMVFTGTLAGLTPIEVLGHMTSIGTLLAFSIVCAGVLVLRHTDPTRERRFRAPFSPVVPVLGIVVCLAMMLSLGWVNWLRLGVWMAIGLLIYFAYSRRHSRLIGEAA